MQVANNLIQFAAIKNELSDSETAGLNKIGDSYLNRSALKPLIQNCFNERRFTVTLFFRNKIIIFVFQNN